MSKQDDVESRIVNSIRRTNETCVQGQGFDGLADLFHKDMAMIHPHFSARAEGRDIGIKCYRDACSQMKFHKMDASEQQIEIFDAAAAASHKYNCVWDYRGKTSADDDHEILVFVRRDGPPDTPGGARHRQGRVSHGEDTPGGRADLLPQAQGIRSRQQIGCRTWIDGRT